MLKSVYFSLDFSHSGQEIAVSKFVKGIFPPRYFFMSAELDELYQDLILDHYKYPRCQGCINNPDARADVVNPLCGDQISLTLSGEDNRITEILFSGKGCSISQASASMMSEACKGLTLTEAREVLSKFKLFMHGESGLQELESAGSDLVALQGVRKFTARIKCALLAWEAMSKCIEDLALKEGQSSIGDNPGVNGTKRTV